MNRNPGFRVPALAEGRVGAASVGVTRGLVESGGEVVRLPVKDHLLYTVLRSLDPAFDLPVRAIDDGLGVAEASFEEGQAADDCTSDGVAEGLGGEGIACELRIQEPVPIPLGAELRGGLIVLGEKDSIALSQHVEAASVEDGLASYWMIDGKGNGEGELDRGLPVGHAEGLDDVRFERVLDEVLDQGEENPWEGLGFVEGDVVVPPEEGEGLEAFDQGLFLVFPTVVEGPASGFQPCRVGPAGVKVDILPLVGEVAEGGVVPIQGAFFKGR